MQYKIAKSTCKPCHYPLSFTLQKVKLRNLINQSSSPHSPPSLDPTMANLLSLLLLLVPLIVLSVSASILTSIDCGAADSYIDSNFIPWVGDELYISTGESRVVQNAASVSHVLSTLRVFSTGKKNCYSFEVDKGSQILVRASFYYGNYDKRSSPPSFDLQFDGNYWDTVTTSMDGTEVYEAIYAVKGDTTSVCVAQTQPNQLPFISSIEVSTLDANMYNKVTTDYALFLLSRSAFGANQTVRYPDDAYDRIWTAVAASNGLTTVTSDALFINSNIGDNPPSPVLQNALTSAAVTHSIVLTPPNLKTEVPIYINTYFSEVAQLDPSDKRSIQIFINNISEGEPFVPPYESAVEYTIYNITANTTVTLSATADSTLPPILNALEIFTVSDILTSGTDSNDVQALSSLQNGYEKLKEWRGDPCLPATFNWEWVACSSDPIPRITALYLNGLQLNGPLPDFSALDAIQTIDMHNNSINGDIPDFLGTLPNLKQLNLADNDFSGPIPSSISNNKKIKLDVSGNPNLCVSGKKCETTNTGTSPGIETSPGTSTTRLSTGKKKNKLPVILGSSIPSFLVFWAVVGFVVITQKRRKTTGQMGGPGKPGGPPAAMTTGSAMQVHAVNGQSPAAHHQTSADDITVDIAQQMGSELDDLFQQQAQENENGHNNN